MADRDEREQQIAKIIALVLFDSREVPPPKCVEAARRIAALPQPITAETVRRVRDIMRQPWDMSGIDTEEKLLEFYAQCANVEVE